MTTWTYIKRGAIRDEEVGPIDTEMLARRIEKGEIKPDTPIASPEKTQGQFVEMRRFAKLAIIYEQGREAREEAKQQQKAERAAQKAETKRERALAKRERKKRPEPREVGPPAPQVLPAEQPMPAPMPAYAPQPQPQAIQQSTTVNVKVGRGFNHLLHLGLTVVTCGAWLPIWIICWLIHVLT